MFTGVFWVFFCHPSSHETFHPTELETNNFDLILTLEGNTKGTGLTLVRGCYDKATFLQRKWGIDRYRYIYLKNKLGEGTAVHIQQMFFECLLHLGDFELLLAMRSLAYITRIWITLTYSTP